MSSSGDCDVTRWRGAACLAAIAALTLTYGSAPAAEGIPSELLACLSLADDAQRLACFDREVGRYRAAPAQNFGEPREHSRWAAPADLAAAKALQELTSKIAATATRPDGALQFTLENGQVWVQAHPEYIDGVSAGDGATIKTGMGGTFYLYNTRHYGTQVRRVK